jgi:Ca-activated chloride channel family protein
MRRMLLLLALLLLPAVPTFAQASSSAHVTQIDTAHYPDVTLYVSVTDPSGNPVGGLAARDFAITEDGQPVTISNFVGGGATSISTVLVIDRSASMGEANKMRGAREAARAFVRQMRPGDQTAVIAFDSRPELIVPFTSDTARLDQAIRRIDTGESTALYDSLVAGVDLLKDAGGRRALLLVTDGRDCIQEPCADNPASTATLDGAIKSATAAGQPVQVIGLGDRDDADERTGIDEGVLRQIADQTGGAYFYAPGGDQLADLYRKLSADMQREYALTYHSPRPFYDGTRRDIRVSVGGAPAASGGYVERHLIDVRSNPLIGFLLLLPILGALLLPSLLRGRAAGTTGTTGPSDSGPALTPPLALIAQDRALATGSTILKPGLTVLPPDVPRCMACDEPLLPNARFCSACGATQAPVQQTAARRVFCDQCGRPMRAGARFCSECGATAPIPVAHTA